MITPKRARKLIKRFEDIEYAAKEGMNTCEDLEDEYLTKSDREDYLTELQDSIINIEFFLSEIKGKVAEWGGGIRMKKGR